MKQCSKCEQLKSEDCFHRDSRAKTGLTSWCKECYAAHQKKNLPKILAKRKLQDKSKKNTWSRDHYNKRRLEWIESQGGKCRKCGSKENLEIDHVDPTSKLCQPNAIWRMAKAKREVELAKCQVLCHDCHRAKSAQAQLGEGNPNVKLKLEEVKEIRRLHTLGMSQSSIAKQYNVHQYHINCIVRNKYWRTSE